MKVYTIGNATSFVFLVTALISMLSVPQLRKITRNRIHVQLFISFIMRDLTLFLQDYNFMIIMKENIKLGELGGGSRDLMENDLMLENGLGGFDAIGGFDAVGAENCTGDVLVGDQSDWMKRLLIPQNFCKTMNAIGNYFEICGLSWVFIEAFYLHTGWLVRKRLSWLSLFIHRHTQLSTFQQNRLVL